MGLAEQAIAAWSSWDNACLARACHRSHAVTLAAADAELAAAIGSNSLSVRATLARWRRLGLTREQAVRLLLSPVATT